MLITELLEIDANKGELISIVGGGGKTSIMMRLAKELKAAGKRVLITTTTAIYVPGGRSIDRLLLGKSSFKEYIFLSSPTDGITAAAKFSDGVKLKGFEPGLIDSIRDLGIFDFILVEADGSRGAPIKAPGEHEPVIPMATDRVIGVIGLDCMGKKIYSQHVHRSEPFCKITGCAAGDYVSPWMVARLIESEKGLFKGAPKGSKKYVFLNKAEGEHRRNAALETVDLLLGGSCHESDGLCAASLYLNKAFIKWSWER
ncbi:selenium cofactor biosynthesis protein YqeC [Peptoclostridium acidaminophilum]|nr:selenium cofactor biosynthesis protein YqeC [Peptoclostridium acidaminophilum]